MQSTAKPEQAKLAKYTHMLATMIICASIYVRRIIIIVRITPVEESHPRFINLVMGFLIPSIVANLHGHHSERRNLGADDDVLPIKPFYHVPHRPHHN
jgi:hypothetical protein